jgi:hypothetical protein
MTTEPTTEAMPTITYAEAMADEAWPKILKAVYEGRGDEGYKVLKDAIQNAVNEGEALAYAKRTANF